MPVSSGLRSRPSRAAARRLSAHRPSLTGLAHLVPRVLILPIILAGAITAATAATWTYSLHQEMAMSDIDSDVTTGSVPAAQ